MLHKDVDYEEPLLLFHGSGKVLENISAQSGPIFSARGLAVLQSELLVIWLPSALLILGVWLIRRQANSGQRDELVRH